MSEYLFDKVAKLANQKETPTQVFSCEFFATFKNTYFEEHLQMTASISGVNICKNFFGKFLNFYFRHHNEKSRLLYMEEKMS